MRSRKWVGVRSIRVAITFSLLLVSLSAFSDQSAYSLGLAAYLKQDYSAAQTHWTQAARQENSARAMFNLGLMHHRNQVSNSQSERAEYWFKRAADNGYAAAYYYLSEQARLQHDTARADSYMEQAADSGFRTPRSTSVEQTAPGRVEPEQRVSRQTSEFLTSQWLQSQPAEHWTIQLLVFDAEEAAQAYIVQHSLQRKVAYFYEVKDGTGFYKLVYGVYPTKEDANRARNALPGNMTKDRPWLRDMASIQTAIRRAR